MDVLKKFSTGIDKGSVIFSDESVDAHKDIVRQGGWDLSRFYGEGGEERNPVMLYGHDRDGFPIGKWANVRVMGDKLMGEPVFADKENPQAKIAKQLFEGGFLKSVSVSFRPIEWKDMDNGGREYLKQELLEVSFVSVPANPNALARAIEKGVVTEDDVQKLREISPEDLPGDAEEKVEEKIVPTAKDVIDMVDEYKKTLDSLITLSEELTRRVDALEKMQPKADPAPEVALTLKDEDPQDNISTVSINREDVAEFVREAVAAEVRDSFGRKVNYVLGKVEE